MTINYVYKKVKKAMDILENIDFMDIRIRKNNQRKVNEAFDVLDNLKDALIREDIKNKQGGTND